VLARHSKTSLITAGDFCIGRVVNTANGIRPPSGPKATDSRTAKSAKKMFGMAFDRRHRSATASTSGNRRLIAKRRD
jgi:hypothetical protein